MPVRAVWLLAQASSPTYRRAKLSSASKWVPFASSSPKPVPCVVWCGFACQALLVSLSRASFWPLRLLFYRFRFYSSSPLKNHFFNQNSYMHAHTSTYTYPQTFNIYLTTTAVGWWWFKWSRHLCVIEKCFRYIKDALLDEGVVQKLGH